MFSTLRVWVVVAVMRHATLLELCPYVCFVANKPLVTGHKYGHFHTSV